MGRTNKWTLKYFLFVCETNHISIVEKTKPTKKPQKQSEIRGMKADQIENLSPFLHTSHACNSSFPNVGFLLNCWSKIVYMQNSPQALMCTCRAISGI